MQPQIKTLAIKDFQWEKKNGMWKTQDTQFGKGMVDFKTYFRLLKQYKINVPVSLHFEYPLGGADKGTTNGIQLVRVRANTYATGNRGIGLNYGVGNTNADFGFTSFSASAASATGDAITRNVGTTAFWEASSVELTNAVEDVISQLNKERNNEVIILYEPLCAPMLPRKQRH